TGDPFINNQVPYFYNATTTTTTATQPATAAVYSLNNGLSTLAWSGGTEFLVGAATSPPIPAPGALPSTTTTNALPAMPTTENDASQYFPFVSTSSPATSTAYLGSNSNWITGASAVGTDDRQHPFWRSELLQKAMNLTTVRTHQYAVWITIGFFEVKRQGDIAMVASNFPWLAYDLMGPEVGAVSG